VQGDCHLVSRNSAPYPTRLAERANLPLSIGWNSKELKKLEKGLTLQIKGLTFLR